jgi:hypothetical protein
MDTPSIEKDSGELFSLLKPLYLSVSLLRQSNYSLLQISQTLKKLDNNTTLSLASYLGTGLPYSTFSSAEGISKLEYLLYSNTGGNTNNYFRECSRWSLDSAQSELVRYSNELKHTTGVFYVSDFSHGMLNDVSSNFPELTPVRASVDNQLQVIRWQRWLYKYNILHRSVLKTPST